MTKLAQRAAQYAALAALAIAAAAPGLALAQTTGTRLPTTVVDTVYVKGAIADGSQTVRGEEPADATIAELPAVYEEAAPAAGDAAQPAASK